MYGHEVRAKEARGLERACDSGRDIVEFQIEEDPGTCSFPDRFEYVWTLADEKLKTYLEETYVIDKALYIKHRLIKGRQIQRKDNVVLGFLFHNRASWDIEFAFRAPWAGFPENNGQEQKKHLYCVRN
jgi:hypothetical protein